MVNLWLKSLMRMGRHFGGDPLLVQASGGNVSVKSDEAHIAIKASGARLHEMTPRAGWAMADQNHLAHGLARIPSLKSWKKREGAYVALLKKSSHMPKRHLSMETGFH